MSDPASTARSARESLAKGLSALQADPSLPPRLLELAAPIAQSMGALHQIERSNGTQLQPHASMALENVRTALQSLQTQGGGHPAVNAAMEAVAASLGMVHALNQLAGGGAPAQQPPRPAAPAPQPMAAPQQAYVPPHQQGFAAPVAPMAQTVASPGGMGGPAPFGAPQGFPQGAPQAGPPPGYAPPQQPAAQPYVAQAVPQAAPQPAPAARPAGGGYDPFAPGAPAPGQGGDKLSITADLGAQSPTNFYKGLSGNDIVDHGGLFVSTYMIPKIGTPIRIKVSLPGGYEFEADATVRWARDVRDASSDAPPGFGAQFSNVTQEARQLIYRYVRNREPLFHDDL